MYKLWMIPIQYKYFLLLDYVHTVTFSFVFSRQKACKHYQFTTEAVVYLTVLEIFPFGSCVLGVKTIQGTKTFLKKLENDARVHIIALFFN
jgi:hypothetical protein